MTFEEFKFQFAQSGGKAGKGESKRRSFEHYQRMSRKGLEIRRKNAARRRLEAA